MVIWLQEEEKEAALPSAPGQRPNHSHAAEESCFGSGVFFFKMELCQSPPYTPSGGWWVSLRVRQFSLCIQTAKGTPSPPQEAAPGVPVPGDLWVCVCFHAGPGVTSLLSLSGRRSRLPRESRAVCLRGLCLLFSGGAADVLGLGQELITTASMTVSSVV